MRTIAFAIVAVFALAPSLAHAEITSVTWDPARSQSPTFGGLSFGSVGQYEKLRGTAKGVLDPNDSRNRVITDIQFAPVNAKGMVEYSMDVFVLKPINLANGNQRLFFDFNNRGQMRLGRLNQVDLNNEPTTAADAGDGFVMKHGFAVAANGWDFGATGTANMKISVPKLTGLPGPSYEYLVFDNSTTTVATLTFPANSLDTSLARLTVRAHLDDTPERLLDNKWEYTSTKQIRLLPAGTNFQQSAIYELTYTARDPVVSGVGLAATRDWVSFLRYASAAEGNPLAAVRVQHTYSYSISQPSRTLNDFVRFGFNEDLKGRRVLDGILSHTGGGSGDQINYRYGQTGRTERNRQNHLYPEGVFPFAHQLMTDQLSGRTAGRDERCTASSTCPNRFEVNTSNEYWVKAGSLLHTNTYGEDLKGPENVRYYLMSGQSHGVGDVTDRGVCQQFTNGVSPYRAHRALLLALDAWVSYGIAPPKSEIPEGGHRAWAVTRPGFETGVMRQDELGWPSIPGVTYTGVITTRYSRDFGSRFESGILDNYPASLVGRASYPIFVSKVDHDGNEIAGVRMPGVEAPTATTTGWALRRAEFGGPDGCESDGQNIPFATTKKERLRNGDPRKSLEERYKDHDGYVKEVAKAARKLQKDGFLIEQDVQSFIDEAQASGVLR